MSVSVLWVACQKVVHLALHLLLNGLAHDAVWQGLLHYVTEKVREIF